MILPCRFKASIFNKHLTKGFIANYNAKHETKYCAVIINNEIQSRTVEQAKALLAIDKNLEVIW